MVSDARVSTLRLQPDALTTRTLEDAVTDLLRVAILTGELAPGTELRQARLAAQLGVSRIPLRDSLHRLEAEGLVRIDGRRGARVATLSPSDVEEIYDLRLLLEPEAARRALAAIDDATAAQLVRLSQEMDRDADDALAGYRARRRFYAELYGHCGNPRLATTVMRLRDEVSHYHLLAAGESARAHREFRRCIQRRDCDGAADVLGRHLARARDDLLASLKTAAETAG